MDDFTIVLGVDTKHLHQLQLVLPTWKRHKPSLFKVPWVVFYDVDQLPRTVVQDAVPHATLVPWPPPFVYYEGVEGSKWECPQRNKMFAGFVHVAAHNVTTRRWLKLDTDVVAMGMDDWINDKWFDGSPGIVSHKWGYTKPADQLIKLDRWADKYKLFPYTAPLDLYPEEGSSKVKHNRVISWCGFFSTRMTMLASTESTLTCGHSQIPVPSQDGFLWYYAKRTNRVVNRVNMKDRGWSWQSSHKNIVKAVEESMRTSQ